MLCLFPADMLQCLCYHLVKKLSLQADAQPALLYFCHGKQILHQIDEPDGIVINIQIQLFFRLLVKHFPIG